ncbi:hypothetical protein [Legionella quinlivanii]|uniref:hypothetical protein n=1 Tax=Legionella quinlivanii TaxID=45073 RepID=UPI0022443893|nr:hypothetical protein [Legionella quinlivanii]MCW8451944.1 hypothetical protein [Legionella quinlivanii]
MTETMHVPLPWLIDENCRLKAELKYAIKINEAKLKPLLESSPTPSYKTSSIVEYCHQLIGLYEKLSRLNSSVANPVWESPLLFETIYSQCIARIEKCRIKWRQGSTDENEARSVDSLLFYYRNLIALVLDHDPKGNCGDNELLAPLLRKIIQAKSVSEWLSAIIHFANRFNDKVSMAKEQFLHLNERDCLGFYQQLTDPEYVELVNALFFYKMQPGLLYGNRLSTEKEIEVKNTLCQLHYFIEVIHQTILHNLKQRGYNPVQDYLFHGDELPPGICVQINEMTREIIKAALQQCEMPNFLSTNDLIHQGLNDLFRAYKYWFNPNRLIDAAMYLRSQLVSPVSEPEGNEFLQQMIILYQQLSTEQCIDLYGYFSNKDTRYLLRTLQAAAQGQMIRDVELLKENERLAVIRVYQVMEDLMAALLCELKNRHILMAAYPDFKHDTVVRPGRRNLQALSRILTLYSSPEMNKNSRLETLFKSLEKLQQG